MTDPGDNIDPERFPLLRAERIRNNSGAAHQFLMDRAAHERHRTAIRDLLSLPEELPRSWREQLLHTLVADPDFARALRAALEAA